MKKYFLSILVLLSLGTTNCVWKWAGAAAAVLGGYTAYSYHSATKETQRTAYNQINLKNLKEELNKNASCAIISDIHDVVVKRLPGDLERVGQLTARQLCSFFCGLSIFGPKYISHKLFGYPTHPSIETYALSNTDTAANINILRLINPFELNLSIYDIYKNCTYPIFACSNIGDQSYNYMNDQSDGKLDELFKDKQISTPENGHLQKDRAEMFEQLAEKMKAVSPKIALMIDDKRKNIEKCKEILKNRGIEVFGYIFKNTDEFIKDMRKINIFPSKK